MYDSLPDMQLCLNELSNEAFYEIVEHITLHTIVIK